MQTLGCLVRSIAIVLGLLVGTLWFFGRQNQNATYWEAWANPSFDKQVNIRISRSLVASKAKGCSSFVVKKRTNAEYAVKCDDGETVRYYVIDMYRTTATGPLLSDPTR